MRCAVCYPVSFFSILLQWEGETTLSIRPAMDGLESLMTFPLSHLLSVFISILSWQVTKTPLSVLLRLLPRTSVTRRQTSLERSLATSLEGQKTSSQGCKCSLKIP